MTARELPLVRCGLAVVIVVASVVFRQTGLAGSADLLGGVASHGLDALPLGLSVLVLHAATWLVAPVLAVSALISLATHAWRSRPPRARPTLRA